MYTTLEKLKCNDSDKTLSKLYQQELFCFKERHSLIYLPTFKLHWSSLKGAWYLYKMVAMNMLRTYFVKQAFFEEEKIDLTTLSM